MLEHRTSWARLALCALLSWGCDAAEDDGTGAASHGEDDDHDEDHDHDHDHASDDNAESEVFTRVELTFTPEGGGQPVIAAFSDPDGDGGESGTADPITLATDTTYALTVTFANELVDPVEDVTEEIRDEAEEHQVFFSGDAVGGLLLHTYADKESDYTENALGDDLPVGLLGEVTSSGPGAGSLTVQLQHLPDLNGSVVKVPGLETVYPEVPGWPDVVVRFEVTVR